MILFYHRGDVDVRPSIGSDIHRMQSNLRASDMEEIRESHGHTPLQALEYGLKHSSVCLTVLYKNEPVAMAGIVPDANVKKAAVAWLLGTNGIYKMKLSFLRISKLFLGEFQKHYPLLYNFIPPHNKLTIKWLSWLGAELDSPQPLGVNKEPFQYFCIHKEPALV